MARLLAAIRYCVLVSSGLLLAFVALCFWGQFDFCMAVTVFPPWCWAGAGVVLAALGFARERKHPRLSMVLVGAWLAFLLVFADSPASLVRRWLPEPRPAGNLRVVSFNCMSSLDAIEEVVTIQPDVVLFQESRGRAKLEALGERMYGAGEHACWGPDASIVARGTVTMVEVPPEYGENFVHARVETEGSTIEVISLRLIPSVFRLDLWSPSCWSAFRHNREQRRRQLATMVSYLETIPSDRAVIFGGDFNAPPGDAVLRLLRPRLADAFVVAGRGWGGTITSDWPAIRIDQLWTSGPIEAASVRARRSRFSDHRMVVGDFRVDEQR